MVLNKKIRLLNMSLQDLIVAKLIQKRSKFTNKVKSNSKQNKDCLTV